MSSCLLLPFIVMVQCWAAHALFASALVAVAVALQPSSPSLGQHQLEGGPTPVVTSKSGPVQGLFQTTLSVQLAAFRGIPYAAPPVGRSVALCVRALFQRTGPAHMDAKVQTKVVECQC